MAKLIRFPLKLTDGTEARSLEDLREHGDVESVLKHYREGTLARWLKAFRYDELAERVAEHRNAQLEGSKANLQEVFPLLGIPLEEAAFAEYCENKLSKGFVFSDADGGDLKTYGQGVSIKDKLVEFLPEGKLPGGDSLEDWEVTETELDEGNLLVEFTCEKRNILVSLQFACEDECYKKVTNQLERLVNAFNPAAPGYDTENTQESPKAQDVQELRNYRIGDTGPGGGTVFYNDGKMAYEIDEQPQDRQENVEFGKINNQQELRNYRIGERGPSGGLVFHIDGKMAYEVSDVLGRLKWGEAEDLVAGCHRGGFFDWRLPTKEELNLVYQKLRKPGIIGDKDWFWSSSQHIYDSHHAQRFDDGHRDCFNDVHECSVRAVRSFSIDEQPQDRQENVEFGKINNQQELRNYRIGERGPGGGLVFHIDGKMAYEVSDVLGRLKWWEAEDLVAGCHRGGLFDWRLPTKEELNLVYQNLRKPRIIGDKDWFWSSSQHIYDSHHAQRFDDGHRDCFNDVHECSVRAIRAFSIVG